jgi:hypothetical protein
LRIHTRVIVITLLLVASLAGVGLKIFWVWQQGPWNLPEPVKPKPVAERGAEKAEVAAAPSIVGTDVIIAKNLFDPERGASRTKETEADARGAQRIRSLVLLGTAVLGSSRYAIVQDGDGAARPPTGTQAAAQGPRRMKIGDSIEGFNLTEVGEKAVVFAKGATRVELLIDYFRKVPVAAAPTALKPAQPRLPGQVAPGAVPGQVVPGQVGPGAAPGVPPRVIPNLPRRSRLPIPPGQ